MGRYYDDFVSTAGLNPANSVYADLISAANNVDRKESQFYKERRKMFKELNNGTEVGSVGDVEDEYADLCDLDVYDFRSEFNRVAPARKAGSGIFRYVRVVPWESTEFTAGFAVLYKRGEEDDDGDSQFELADEEVLNYNTGAGKVNIDTLYPKVRAFDTKATYPSNTYFELDEDADGDDVYESATVFNGFGEVPRRYNAKDGYTSQDLQVMGNAGEAYEELVRPAINEYFRYLGLYEAQGGGPLEFEFYTGTPDFPYQDYIGTRISYNRPAALSPGLIDLARGFS
jgi:hypothetical protein